MRNVYKNIISSAFPQIVSIVTNLVLPGMIIARFGSEINGLVASTKTIVSYISLVGAGIAAAVTQALYQPVAAGNETVVKGMLHSANNMFNRYGCIFLMITLIVSVIYPFAIRSDIPYLTVMLLLIVMSLSGASEFFAIGRCRALLYAHQKAYICSLIQALSLFLSLGLAVLLLHLEVGIVAVQFSISFVYVLRGFFLSHYIRKAYPQYVKYKNEQAIPAAIQKRKDAMIHQLSGLAVTGSQSVILTLLVDLNAASIYAVYNVVLYGIRSVFSNLCTSITPYFGKKCALNQEESLRNIYNAVEFVFFYSVTFVLMVTLAMIIPFVTLYTKGADIPYVFPDFAFLFVVSSAFYILKLPGTSLINVAGHFRETKLRAIIEAVTSIGLSILCTLQWGMNGVLLGTGIALGWRCIDTIVYSSKYILRTSARRSIFRFVISLVNILFCKLIVDSISFAVGSWFMWICYAICCSVLAAIVLIVEAVLLERDALASVWKYLRAR